MSTIAVKEERKNINKFREWYKNKVVDSGFSEKAEKNMELRTNVIKTKNKIASKILKPIVMAIPEISWLGPILPAIAKLGDSTADLDTKLFLSTKRFVEGKLIGVDGSNKDITIPSLNFDEYTKNLTDITKSVSEGIKNYDNTENQLDQNISNEGKTL